MTLVELLVVSALLAMLSAIVYSALGGIMRGSSMIDNQRNTHRVARFSLMRMTKEISSAVAKNLSAVEEGQDRPKGYLSANNLDKGSIDADSLTFVTASGAQAVFDAPGNFGYVQITYRLEESPRDEQPKEVDTTVYRLMRDETSAGAAELKTRADLKIITPIADRIVSLNFRYYEKDTWQNEWPSTTSLPSAIEITVAVLGSGGKIERFKTAISTGQALRQK